MYRHFLPACEKFRLNNLVYAKSPFRLLSSAKDDDGTAKTGVPTITKDSGKKRQPVKSVVTKLKLKSDLKENKKDTTTKIDIAKAKLDSLTQEAQKFTSVGPNDKKSASQYIGKPTTYIRRSARKESDTTGQLAKEHISESIQILDKGLDKKLVEAARRVASKMPRHIAKATEKELLESIERQSIETLNAKKQMETGHAKEDITKSISYQIMRENRNVSRRNVLQDELDNRIGSTVEKIQMNRGQSGWRPTSDHLYRKDTSIFSGECLNIFDSKSNYINAESTRNTIKQLLQEEIQNATNIPKENPFDEMARWTRDGKMWQYPINNEQGLEAEEEVPFYKHVLFDDLLEGFPDKGPVRQFMDLVVMGLSHNPYITVQRKHATIEYYKNFFEEKQLLDLELTEST